jgi:hypothetical protein
VRYRHPYSKYVDLNDAKLTEDAIAKNPKMFNRRFTLRRYKTIPGSWKPEYGRRETGERKFQMAKGELARMKKAGLIHQAI